jgi:hypothetical protein
MVGLKESDKESDKEVFAVLEISWPSALEIIGAYVGKPADRTKERNWDDRIAKWNEHLRQGKCCFCGRKGWVYPAGECRFRDSFGFDNFLDWDRRAFPTGEMCETCIKAFKEDRLRTAAVLYMIAYGDRGSRGVDGRLVLDNRTLFDGASAAGREAFLRRLLDDVPERPFVCGWKRSHHHVLPFSPVNPPGAAVVAVVYQPTVVYMPAGGGKPKPNHLTPVTVYFDRFRHRALVEEAYGFWARAEAARRDKAPLPKFDGLLADYQGALLLDMILQLTRPDGEVRRAGRRGERNQKAASA